MSLGDSFQKIKKPPNELIYFMPNKNPPLPNPITPHSTLTPSPSPSPMLFSLSPSSSPPPAAGPTQPEPPLPLRAHHLPQSSLTHSFIHPPTPFPPSIHPSTHTPRAARKSSAGRWQCRDRNRKLEGDVGKGLFGERGVDGRGRRRGFDFRKLISPPG